MIVLLFMVVVVVVAVVVVVVAVVVVIVFVVIIFSNLFISFGRNSGLELFPSLAIITGNVKSLS